MVQKGRSTARCIACEAQAPLEREEEQDQPVAELG
jgi:hypothetical protein